jgi:hypothetical protein
MRRIAASPLDTIARGLADGPSRREAMRPGGAALFGAAAITPADAWAAATGHCPGHRVKCRVPQCPTGETNCHGMCVDLSSNASFCGSCAVACPTGAVCVGGNCACPTGMSVCGGACVDLQTSFDNCGQCGAPCSDYFATSACMGGTCHIISCAPGWINCSGNPRTGCETLGTKRPS